MTMTVGLFSQSPAKIHATMQDPHDLYSIFLNAVVKNNVLPNS